MDTASVKTPLTARYSSSLLFGDRSSSYSHGEGFSANILKSVFGITVALYALNQAHLLPKPFAAVVSKLLFYPTLPITAFKRINNWVTKVDETIVLGGAPLNFFGYPAKLKNEYNVKGVINMCEEYRGPIKEYKKLGIEQLWLPTVDHYEPSEEDLITAVSFIQRHEAQGSSVYVHCRAGHGRSGAVVFAYMLHKHYLKYSKVTKKGSIKDTDDCDTEQLNIKLCSIRNVRRGLWKQANVKAFHQRLIRNKGSLINMNDDFFSTTVTTREAERSSSLSTMDNKKKNDNTTSKKEL